MPMPGRVSYIERKLVFVVVALPFESAGESFGIDVHYKSRHFEEVVGEWRMDGISTEVFPIPNGAVRQDEAKLLNLCRLPTDIDHMQAGVTIVRIR
jgi:hypothetical protein